MTRNPQEDLDIRHGVHTAAERDRLKALNAELVAALSFYADPAAWNGPGNSEVTAWPLTSATIDRGKSARAAIAKAAST